MMKGIGLLAFLGLLAAPGNVSALPGLFQRGRLAGAVAEVRGIESASSIHGQPDITIKDFMDHHPIAHGEAVAYRQSQSGEAAGIAAFLKQVGLPRVRRRADVGDETGQESEEVDKRAESWGTNVISGAAKRDGSQQGSSQPSQGKPDNRTSYGQHAQSLDKIHLKQLEALKQGHLQADEQLGMQQEAERLELRAKQQAAVDHVMAAQGKPKLGDYSLAEDGVLRMALAPLEAELQRQSTALLARQKEAKIELLRSQTEKLDGLQAQQATRSKEMGLQVSGELLDWADAYRRELEGKANPKPKQVKEPPNPFCSGSCARRRR